MDIRIVWCKRTARCGYCPELIEKCTPMIRKIVWRSRYRKWTVRFYYHPQCFMAQALEYLNSNPFVSEGGGRPRLELSREDAKTRYLLLRKKAALEQRRRQIKTGFPDKILMEARIDARIVELAGEMEKVGGVPKKWKVV